MLSDEYAWFAVFWALVTTLCVVEAIWPGPANNAARSRRWPVNFGFGILNGLIASVAPSLTVLAAVWAEKDEIGVLNGFEGSLWLSILVVLAARSFTQYAFHRSMHHVPVLWRVHRVHHCDDHLDATSALRFHPLEMIATIAFAIPFILVFGLPPKVLAAYETVQVVFALFTHANIRTPDAVDRGLRILLVTPILHRFHHSTRELEANSNYGDVLSVWDRIFGTFRDVPRGTSRPEQFGLDDVGPELAGDFVSQLELRRHS